MKHRVLLYQPSASLTDALEAIPGWRSAVELIPGRPGKSVAEQVKEARPDLLLLDVDELGHESKRVVADAMKAASVPILLLSDFTHKGSEAAIEALSEGAKDVVESPRAPRRGRGRKDRAGEVLDRIEELVARRAPAPAKARDTLPVVVVGVSTGGPATLGTLLAGLPAELPAALLIVQHMPPRFTEALADRWNAGTKLTVREAREGDTLAAGVALVAPGGRHLEIGARGKVGLSLAETAARFVPSIDLAMFSVAREIGPGVIGLLLTGMGKDGILGLRAIKRAGGRTLAQDEASSVVYGMPKAAAELGLADSVLPLDALAEEIDRLVRRTDRFLRRARP